MTNETTPVFDFDEFLKSDELAFVYNFNKRNTTFVRVTGSLSTIASIGIIAYILRSHQGLSTTYHRLIFVYSVTDALFSFVTFVIGPIMVPKETDYIVPGSMGNQATCDAQGFLLNLLVGMTLFYTSSICFYYLTIVTFNKKDDFIRRKVEPWLHAIPILIPLATSSMIASINGYNSNGFTGICSFTPNQLPHCTGLEHGEIRDGFTIPCGRGDGKGHETIYSILYIVGLRIVPLSTPIAIVLTMGLMYRSVHMLEKKMQKYGAGALRLRNRARNDSQGDKKAGGTTGETTDGHGHGNGNNRFVECFKNIFRKIPCIRVFCGGRERPGVRSNSVAAQKRAILRRAAAYVTAWALSYIPFFFAGTSQVSLYFFVLFYPLQGLFNFAVFMYPKVISAKRGVCPGRTSRERRGRRNSEAVEEIGWCRALLKAYMSRGENRKAGRSRLTGTGTSRSKTTRTTTVQRVSNKVKKAPTRVSGVALSMKSSHVRNTDTDGGGTGIATDTSCKQQQNTRPFAKSEKDDKMVKMVSFADADTDDHAHIHTHAPHGNDIESPTLSLETNSNDARFPLVLTEENDNLRDVEGEEYLVNNDEIHNDLENDEAGGNEEIISALG